VKAGLVVKASTLYQPWATLVAKGLKVVETRTTDRFWRSMHGRPVAIHAGRARVDDAWGEIVDWDRGTAITVKERAHEWPRGEVVAVSRVGRVWRCTGDDGPGEPMGWRTASELALCDARQRVCVELDNTRELKEPVPARGYQGLWGWRVPDHVQEELAGTGLLDGLGFAGGVL